MSNIVIGIEGYVGAGKTSICKELLNEIPNSILLHGGNLYRAIVYALMNMQNNHIELKSLSENLQNIDIKALMDKLQVRLELENRETVFYVANEKIDDEKLQSKDNSLAVSIAGKSADNSKLYAFGRTLIEMYKQKFNVIVSGRDLMKIYPNLDYHFLITASLDERVRRKCIQYNEIVNQEEIRDNIIKRDELQEAAGYYKKYDKTIEVDVTNFKNAKEGAMEILHFIKEF